jgi:hypothetical protein
MPESHEENEETIKNDFKKQFIMLCFKERLAQSTTNKLVKLLEEFAQIGQSYVRSRMQSEEISLEAITIATNENPFCKKYKIIYFNHKGQIIRSIHFRQYFY